MVFTILWGKGWNDVINKKKIYCETLQEGDVHLRSVHTPRYLPCDAVRYHIQVQMLTGHVLTYRIARQITRSMNWPLERFGFSTLWIVGLHTFPWTYKDPFHPIILSVFMTFSREFLHQKVFYPHCLSVQDSFWLNKLLNFPLRGFERSCGAAWKKKKLEVKVYTFMLFLSSYYN